MRKKLYNKFNRIFHNSKISFLLASIIMFFIEKIIYVFFFIRSIKNRNYDTNFSIEKSRNRISNLHPNRLKKINVFSNSSLSEYDLSIIIPVYNGEEYIIKCLNSIIEQKTKYTYQVIIINDGSTDNTSKILDKYSKKNFLILTQENQGISAARNKGLKMACGKYIMFVDSDDFLYPNAIEALMDNAITNNVDIVEGNFNFVNDDNASCALAIRKKNTYINLLENPHIIKEISSFPWGRVYIRELWEDVQFPIGLDFEDTIIKAIIFRKAKNYIYLPNIVYGYYRNQNSITRKLNGTVKGLDSYYIIEYIISENQRLNLDIDNLFYTIVLSQMGSILYSRIKILNPTDQFHLLVLLNNLLKCNNLSPSSKLTFKEKHIKESIEDLDLFKWTICCKYL